MRQEYYFVIALVLMGHLCTSKEEYSGTQNKQTQQICNNSCTSTKENTLINMTLLTKTNQQSEREQAIELLYQQFRACFDL